MSECRHEACRKVRELLNEYLDEDLKEVVLRELDEHVEKCPDCHLQVDSVRQTIRLYRKCSDEEVPYDVKIRLRDVIRRAREGQG